MSNTVVFIRRNKIFNDMVLRYSKDILGINDFITISEYKNANLYIDIKKYSISDLTSYDWENIEKALDINEVILKDRLLRNIEYIQAKELVLVVSKYFIELFKNKKYNNLIIYPVDNYVTDIMCKIARYYDIKVNGISNFFIQGYKRVTVYGEYTNVREVSENEVNKIYDLLIKQFKSYMASSFQKALKNSILYYFKFKIRYLYFYIFKYKILNQLEYDYISTPYSATVDKLNKFFPFRYFINQVDNINKKSIYIPMHYHPEATIEHWSDSLKNADYITSLIESVRYFSDNGWEVYLKEHPAMCFRQDLKLYKSLKNIENTYILNPFLETSKIMEKFDSFLIWTGSTGLEALINGKTVYFASSNYYYQKKTNDKYEKVYLETEREKKELIKKVLSNTIEWK
ncbi:hypothetical protein CPG37_04290 [Malaciobacter canalis]|uniref:Capsule biosynthesis protein n=1 Tax=Malaciobacter canalis TaxID=1912871 RepID=A0ABX4LQP4_9BACT|nr:hypothetical protein [Malaciobacter canalis]PHO10271.1 hypothetical protein CPG37_04290 [Malaciobacter canalis]QEE32375.1 hypothetical protein ACAN_0886 [Malaciobacter canalis]